MESTFIYPRWFLYLMLLGIISSCNKLPSNLNWDVDVKIPVLKSKLDISDIFYDKVVVVKPDQSVSLVFSQVISAVDNNNLVEIYDTLANDIFNIPWNIGLHFPPGQEVINDTTFYRLDIEDVEIRKARAKTAYLMFYVTNTFTQPLKIQYTVVSSSKNGQPFVVVDDVPAADINGPAKVVKTIDLSGYNMDFTGMNHLQSNMVISNTRVWIHPDADTIIVTNKDSIIVTTVFEKLEMDYAEGYFGKLSQRVQDTSSLSTFSTLKSGLFDLNNVNASLDITNKLGMDVQMKINSISSINTRTGATIPLQHDIVNKRLNLLRAVQTFDPLNPVLGTHYHYDLSQSNIVEMIENQPDKLNYNVDYNLNPLGDISGGNDFVFSDHSISGIISMEVPLNVRFDNLVIEENTPISFDDNKKINSCMLLVLIENLFPFDVDIQFYLINENNLIVDSLISGNKTARQGIVGLSGFVQVPTHDEIKIPLSPSKLDLLRNTKTILVRAKLNSGSTSKVQLWDHYCIDIKVIAEADYEI